MWDLLVVLNFSGGSARRAGLNLLIIFFGGGGGLTLRETMTLQYQPPHRNKTKELVS